MRWIGRNRDARTAQTAPGESRLLLHVGTPKSATTFLQAQLRVARQDLGSRGWLYPGGTYLPENGLNQQPAMYGVCGPGVHWADDAIRASGRRYFRQMAKEVKRHRGPVVISAEVLSSFLAEEIPPVLDGLGYRRDQIQVIITARDLGRLLGSVWQQNVKNGATVEQGDYLQSVAKLRGSTSSGFWSAYSVPALAQRWAQHVGMDQVTVVPVPHDRALMWPRFAEALGLSEFAERDAEIDPMHRNISLSNSQVELLRNMNKLLEKEVDSTADRRRLRRTLLTAWMSSPPKGAPGTQLDPQIESMVADWGIQDVAQLRDFQTQGLRVVGDLDDLLPRVKTVQLAPVNPPTVPDMAADLLSVVKHNTPGMAKR